MDRFQYTIHEAARPQLKLLLTAMAVSIGIWLLSLFLPFVNYILYPLQLFATFIHEGGHALAAVLTGNSVQSLTVSPDTSGEVMALTSGGFSALLISSAGYLGTTAFGTALLVWMRYGFSSRKALFISSGIVGVLTIVFGVLSPIWNFFANVTILSMAFTVFSGAVLTAGLFAVARYATQKWVDFSLAFLAVQCLLNAIFSLATLFTITTSTTMHSDAANMAAVTGIPGVVWAILWIFVSIVMISLGLRIYAVMRKPNSESLFEDMN